MEPLNNPSTSDNGKTAGIVSYFFIIGWLIAYFALYKDNKTEQAAYQMRQTLLFHIVSMVVSWVLAWFFMAILFSSDLLSSLTLITTLNWVVRVGFIVLWLIGFIGAVNGEKKPIPLLGEKAQTMFSGI